MLARRLTTILPAMSLADALDSTRIPRVAGRTGDRTAVVTTSPWRAPHHMRSDVGLIGRRKLGIACTPTLVSDLPCLLRHRRLVDERP
jgi:predicted ATPase with chaperone activity